MTTTAANGVTARELEYLVRIEIMKSLGVLLPESGDCLVDWNRSVGTLDRRELAKVFGALMDLFIKLGNDSLLQEFPRA